MNGFHVEPGANWPWVARRQQRRAGLLGVEPGQLLLADAADPDVGVVRRLAGHRHDAAGLRVEDHRGAGVGLVVPAGHRVDLGALERDPLGELLLDDRLHLGVDGGDEGVAGRALDHAVVAEHPAHRVDGDAVVAGQPAQPLVVLLLDAGTADDRGAVEGAVVALCGEVVLVLGDRAEVAEHVREVDAERARVGADVLLLGEHARVVLGLLEHAQCDVLRDVGGDRHRLVGRAVPADVADAAGVAARDEAGLDVLGGGVDDHRDPADQLGALVLLELAEQGAVDRDHPGRAVGDERAALAVDDEAALRLHDDVADRLVGGLGLVGLAADDLEVVEPHEERREQGEDERLHDDEPQPAPAGPVGVRCSRGGPLRAEAREEPHQRRQHERA